MLTNIIGQKIEVYYLNELPSVDSDLKYFACIGGSKNYQCFLESKKLSRAEFMKKYKDQIDSCHIPIYEDEDIIIRQDAQIPIPGFYVIATNQIYEKLSYMDVELYKKCLLYSAFVKKLLLEEFDIRNVFMYYEEHYIKPSSTHFWVMPIYDDIINKYGLNPTIFNYDIWKYQDLFEFQNTKNQIYEINKVMRKKLRK